MPILVNFDGFDQHPEFKKMTPGGPKKFENFFSFLLLVCYTCSSFVSFSYLFFFSVFFFLFFFSRTNKNNQKFSNSLFERNAIRRSGVRFLKKKHHNARGTREKPGKPI